MKILDKTFNIKVNKLNIINNVIVNCTKSHKLGVNAHFLTLTNFFFSNLFNNNVIIPKSYRKQYS